MSQEIIQIRERAIGIFDSGVGGLTVVKEIFKVLPYEDIVYLGDTARVPYGTKSSESVKRFAIENAILILLATQQPMARDLRLLAAMLEISTEMERMGDYAKGIARVVEKLGDSQVFIPIGDLTRMCELGTSMLHRALDAFIIENVTAARLIPPEDDEVDILYNKVYRELIEAMIDDPSKIDESNLIMWTAHNLERMADRVTNICERTIFIATGELYEIDSSDDEDIED